MAPRRDLRVGVLGARASESEKGRESESEREREREGERERDGRGDGGYAKWGVYYYESGDDPDASHCSLSVIPDLTDL